MSAPSHTTPRDHTQRKEPSCSRQRAAHPLRETVVSNVLLLCRSMRKLRLPQPVTYTTRPYTHRRDAKGMLAWTAHAALMGAAHPRHVVQGHRRRAQDSPLPAVTICLRSWDSRAVSPSRRTTAKNTADLLITDLLEGRNCAVVHHLLGRQTTQTRPGAALVLVVKKLYHCPGSVSHTGQPNAQAHPPGRCCSPTECIKLDMAFSLHAGSCALPHIKISRSLSTVIRRALPVG
jgi:hypothetical protein